MSLSLSCLVSSRLSCLVSSLLSSRLFYRLVSLLSRVSLSSLGSHLVSLLSSWPRLLPAGLSGVCYVIKFLISLRDCFLPFATYEVKVEQKQDSVLVSPWSCQTWSIRMGTVIVHQDLQNLLIHHLISLSALTAVLWSYLSPLCKEMLLICKPFEYLLDPHKYYMTEMRPKSLKPVGTS